MNQLEGLLLMLTSYVIVYIILILIAVFIRRALTLLLKSMNKKLFESSVVTIEKSTPNAKLSNFSKKYSEHVDVSDEELKMFNTDNIDGLKDYLYDIFYKFEIAYNNLDYDAMRLLSTKQLFKNYYTGITLDLKLGNKRIIEDIERKNVILYEIDSTVAKQSAAIMVEISYKNYVVNKNGDLVSGFRATPITEKFEVEFRNYFEYNDVTKCVNCGAVVTGKKCEYCRTVVSNNDFRICSIRKIVEK